jgi:transposase
MLLANPRLNSLEKENVTAAAYDGSHPRRNQPRSSAAFPKGNKYMQMRDELGGIYTDEMFADLYPKDGQPAIRPWRLALITIMQFAENLTDR